MTAPAAKPLSARSTILSLVLGAHPHGMSARELARAGDLFDIAPSTVRAALTRAVGAGELHREGTVYGLGDRLLERQQRQSDPLVRDDWDGTWEVVVVTESGRAPAERAALRTALQGTRLAELREGVWMRPANLQRTIPSSDVTLTITAEPIADAAHLTAELWDLRGWAAEARATVQALGQDGPPARRLAVAAHLVRHLATDPLLPRELWPRGWPAVEAREAYVHYQRELHARTRD